MHQEMIRSENQNRIRFARYWRSELKNDPNLFKRVEVSHDGKFSLSGFVNQQTVRNGIWDIQMDFFECQTTNNYDGFVRRVEKKKYLGRTSLKTKVWLERFTKEIFGTMRF